MEIISTAKSTKLSSFENLETKYVYNHVENDARDLHFVGRKKLFMEVNKTSGLEILTIKNSVANVNEIVRVRKMKVSNLYCLACPKQSSEIIALGLSSGQVGLLNYRSSEYTAKFPPGSSGNGVIFMDFNASGEYLSTVYENGIINLFGLKTKTKLETLSFDKNSTLARFHPTKRFHLSVASYTGAIYIYDMQSKRKIFRSTDSHGAPCRDICMSQSSPDTLLSVGYDCILNIFDIRRKLSPQQVRSNHPLSTVCVSDCGRYSCVGNLKGELISYDLRNLKSCLETNLIYDSAVVRVAFVPQEDAKNLSDLDDLSGNILTEMQNLPADENTGQPRRDSFFDFINCHSFKGRESMIRRDSFNLQGVERKHNDFDPTINLGDRSSISGRISMELKSINNALPEFEAQKATCSKLIGRRSSLDDILYDKKSKPKAIELIEEENDVSEEVIEITDSADYLKDEEEKLNSNSSENNEIGKENYALNISRKDINYFTKLPDDRNSTPNVAKRYSCTLKDGDKKSETQVSSAELQTVLNEIKDLRDEMNLKLKTLESEIKFHADGNKSDFYMQNFNLWKNHVAISEDIRAMMMGLIRSDPFVTEFIKLQEENENLKATIQNLRKLR